MTRGMPVIEAMLDRGLPYSLGPRVARRRGAARALGAGGAGTHGKTTTSSMLAWILEDAGLSPGFLIGGVPENFGMSARLGEAPFFVIEADEYDTAFFDKRAKFVHYRPRTLVLNNLEYDHADIYPDLAAIERQFQHLLRTVPGSGRIVCNGADAESGARAGRGLLDAGREIRARRRRRRAVERAGGAGQRLLALRSAVRRRVLRRRAVLGPARCAQRRQCAGGAGGRSTQPACRSSAASRHCAASKGVARRMQLRGEAAGVRVYDDFAHHPTAIATTLDGLRRRVGAQRIVAVLEPRSQTMRLGVHQACAGRRRWRAPTRCGCMLRPVSDGTCARRWLRSARARTSWTIWMRW